MKISIEPLQLAEFYIDTAIEASWNRSIAVSILLSHHHLQSTDFHCQESNSVRWDKLGETLLEWFS